MLPVEIEKKQLLGGAVALSGSFLITPYKRRLSASIARILSDNQSACEGDHEEIFRLLSFKYGKEHVLANRKQIKYMIEEHLRLLRGVDNICSLAFIQYDPSPRLLETPQRAEHEKSATKRRRTKPPTQAGDKIQRPFSRMTLTDIEQVGAMLVGGTDGCFYILDTTDGCVNVFQGNGSFARKWSITASGIDNANMCEMAIALHDGSSPQLLMKLKEVDALYAFPPGLLPLCISYYGEDRIYVGKPDFHITIFSPYGLRMRTLDPDQGEEAPYDRTWTVDTNGQIYVASYERNEKPQRRVRIITYRADGSRLRRLFLPDYPENAESPMRMKLDDRDARFLYIVDELGGPAQCYNTMDGSLVGIIGQDRAHSVIALAVHNRFVYLSDEEGKIWVYAPDGRKVREIDTDRQGWFCHATEAGHPLYFYQDNTILRLHTDY